MSERKSKGGKPSGDELLEGLNRAMPFSDEAEKGVLSCLLQDPAERMPEAKVMLAPAAFYHFANRTVYEALCDLDAQQVAIDPPILTHRLREKGLLEKVGGAAGISELFAFVPIPSHWPHYRKIVRDKWIAREGITAYAEGMTALFEQGSERLDEDVLAVLQRGELGVFKVLESASEGKTKGPVHVKEALNELVDHILRLQDNKGKILGISTGIPDLDRAIGGQGLEPGDKFVIGARPKMGKTNLLCTLIKNIAIDQGVPSLVLSMEMSKRRLLSRIAFGHFDIETSKASTGFLDKRGDQINFGHMQRAIANAPLYIDDNTNLTTNDLRSLVRIYKRRYGVRVVFLDYAQLVKAVTKIGSSEERLEIKEVMQTIHEIARDEQVIFIVLAQAGRGAEDNPRHEPGPKDFDGGSAMEKFLDYGAFIHRPSKYKRWKDLKEEERESFRRIVEPLRARHPELWAPERQVRNGMGEPVVDVNGEAVMEWDIEQDWIEHAILILCLNRNGDEARIWLRFDKLFTRFVPRTPKLYSNNSAERQPDYEDRFIAPKKETVKAERPDYSKKRSAGEPRRKWNGKEFVEPGQAAGGGDDLPFG